MYEEVLNIKEEDKEKSLATEGVGSGLFSLKHDWDYKNNLLCFLQPGCGVKIHKKISIVLYLQLSGFTQVDSGYFK